MEHFRRKRRFEGHLILLENERGIFVEGTITKDGQTDEQYSQERRRGEEVRVD
jgi:hypothetical protein